MPVASRAIISGVVIAVLCTAGLPAIAQDGPALKIALVNVPKLRAGFAEQQRAMGELQAWADAKQAVDAELLNYLLLPQQDFAEVIKILDSPPPLSAENQKRLADLKGLCEQKLREYTALQAKTQRTTEESDKFKTLDDQMRQCERALLTHRDAVTDEFNTKRDELEARLTARILDAIQKVATERGYTLALSMAAVLYAAAPADDITDAVTALLNASSGAAPTGTATPAPTNGGGTGAPAGTNGTTPAPGAGAGG